MVGSLEGLPGSCSKYVILRVLQTLTPPDCTSLFLGGAVAVVRGAAPGVQAGALDLLKAQTHRRKLGHGGDTRLNTD